MKIGRETIRRLDQIKASIAEQVQQLQIEVARMEEHAGTKAIVRRLKRSIFILENVVRN